jgi:hypothetical protein
MFGSDILNVALGMVFVYLLLSLICSAVKELIEQVMKHRARDLERSLRELLADPDGTGLVQKIYNHGMVFGLFKGAYNPARSKRNLPSYIPTGNFCPAMPNIIAPDGDLTIASLRLSVARIDNQRVRTALLAMLNDAGSDLARFRDNLEGWFNSAMERASGRYKRRAQMVIFVLGIAGAIFVERQFHHHSQRSVVQQGKARRAGFRRARLFGKTIATVGRERNCGSARSRAKKRFGRIAKARTDIRPETVRSRPARAIVDLPRRPCRMAGDGICGFDGSAILV